MRDLADRYSLSPPPPILSAAITPRSCRAEGLNAFYARDISSITSGILNGYDVVILGEMTLTSAQVTLLTNWVNAGGNLIAMRPDTQLASLLGITRLTNSLSDAYLLVNTSTAPGSGIVNETIQYHGAADLYSLNGATKHCLALFQCHYG